MSARRRKDMSRRHTVPGFQARLPLLMSCSSSLTPYFQGLKDGIVALMG